VFATFITLVLVPTAYLMLDDARRVLWWSAEDIDMAGHGLAELEAAPLPDAKHEAPR
jgi:hypothetical protein